MAYYLLHRNQPSAKRLLASLSRLSRYRATNSVSDSDVLVRWGAAEESDPAHGAVLNTKDAIDRISSRVEMAKFLRRVGVRVAPRSTKSGGITTFTRQYRIPMFDLVPIGCFRSDSGAGWSSARISRVHASFHEISVTEDKQTRRAVFLATRTLHALGLDFGMVSIGVGPKGLLQVMDVTATPVLEGRLLEMYKDAMTAFMEREEQARRGTYTVTLGTDIEIMLRNPQGKMVLASNYFTRRGRIGCDDRSVNFDGKRLPLMELRPAPDPTPGGLLQNLKRLMREASERINRPNVEWRAGSMPFRPYCTGGHIHFSGVPFSSRLVKVLDNYLGLPLMAVEDRRTAGLRRPKYGYLGDIRHKDYGGFEYRTPGSFVCSQVVTTAAFHLAHMLASHYRDFSLPDIYSPSMQIAFYEGQIGALRPLILRNIETIRRHAAYTQYREYIEPLFVMIEQGQTWNEQRDVRVEWGIPTRRTRATGNVRTRRAKVAGAR
ncbi:putative amidoligase domain-containing protein [Alicyclobacillus acidoterrestris]|uniref:putative amidoligase domain-containing protein n=1 Tax=Alicyclobacillus acidoterrestris TaxID=1450 RepID=UPI003F53191B